MSTNLNVTKKKYEIGEVLGVTCGDWCNCKYQPSGGTSISPEKRALGARWLIKTQLQWISNVVTKVTHDTGKNG